VENSTPGVTVPSKSPDQIEHDMADTRVSITEKVAALETQVMGTIQTATDTVTGTVEAVRDAITAAPAAVKETVKETVQAVKDSVSSISVTACVQRNPWASLGVSAAGGFALGFLIGGRSGSNPMRLAGELPATGGRPGVAAPQATAGESRPGGFLDGIFGNLFGGMSETVGTELRRLAEAAIASASAAVKQAIDTQVPTLVQSVVPQAGGGTTKGRGSEYFPRMSEGAGV
jgi:ElaB/YqjD/DUF883 family membrane-anchored ribosome-binding protein